MAKHTPKVKPPQPKAEAAKKSNQPIPVSIPKAAVPAEKWLMILLVAIAFLVNARTINYGYTLDDPFFTKDNQFVKQGVSAIPSFFTHAAYYGVFKNHDASYRPLLLTSFAIEKQLFGFNPQISHFVNLLLFCLQVLVLYRLMRAIFKEYSPYIPFFIVLLFELHPIHTEVVASIKSRDEIMALLFSALCMLQSILYIDTNKRNHLILSGVFFFLALMSKETPVSLVVLVPLTVYFFRNARTANIIRATAPYIGVAIVYLLMRSLFVENDSEKVVILVNNNALKAAANYSEKLATLLYIQLKYLILLVFPHPLSYDYSFSEIPIIGLGNIKAIASIVVIGGLFTYVVMNFRRKDVFAYCILFYGLFAIITSNLLVEIGATMAERFVYTASLGFCIALVFIIAKLLKTDMVRVNYANAKMLFVVVIAIAVLYSGKTIARNEVWNSNDDLYESGLETAPGSWRVHYLLAVDYTKRIPKETSPEVKKDLFTKAIAHYQRSSEILPDNTDVYFLEAYAYDFSGNHDDSAIACYKRTILLDPAKNEAYNNLGAIYLRRSMLDSAIQVLSKVIARDSTYTDALGNLAAAYGNKGQFNEAVRYYTSAIRINPNQPPNVFRSMSNIYRIMGDSSKSKYYDQLCINAQRTQEVKE